MVRVSAVLLLALLISGCASRYIPDEAIYHPLHSDLERTSIWTVQGKIGVKSSEGGANLGFVWKQMPDEYEIKLTAALGTNIAHLSGSSVSVMLTLPDGAKYEGANVNELLDNQLGYPIPVAQLHYWIRGIPDPQYKHQLSETGFDQQSWRVTYRKHGSKGPVKIQIEQGSIRVKLAALKWQY